MNNGLNERGKAIENGYFAKRDRELIEALKRCGGKCGGKCDNTCKPACDKADCGKGACGKDKCGK